MAESRPKPDDGAVDGRVARRERNLDAVLDAVLEMFAEDMMFPTIEQTANRSGLSLRSLYRYFADPGELVEAAIKRSRARSTALAHLSHIGEGSFDERLGDFVSMRVRLHGTNAPMYRATIHNAARSDRIRQELVANRRRFRKQYELQFAPELSALPATARATAVEAGDVLTQLDSIELLRTYRNLSIAKTEAVLRGSLTALLKPAD